MKKLLPKLLVFVIAFLVGGLIGFALILRFETESFVGIDFSFEISVSFLISFYASTIIHEVGHLVFGLISGYGFSSFRIGSIMLLKQNGKFRLCRFSLAGTAGQCLMIPPEPKNGKAPTILYNLGGVIFNLISVLISISLFLTLPYVYVLSLTLLVNAVVSLIFALLNGIPMYTGEIANDGMNALSLSKDDAAATAFLNQLRMNEAQVRGVRLSEMPDDWFEIPDGADKNNVAFSSIAVFAVNRSFDRLDMEKSALEIEELLNSDWKILGVHRNLLICDLIYCRLIKDGKNADISSLITPELLKFMKIMKNFSSIVRTEYALALLRDGDESMANKKLAHFEKIFKTSPNPTEVEVERELMNRALEKFKSGTKSSAEK